MKTIAVTGGSLFQIASEYLGDATQWIRVAQLNGLADPVLYGLVVLRLPETDMAAGGGIVQQ